MELLKKIYRDNKLIDELHITGEDAKDELINLLLGKINKKYKTDIFCKKYHNRIDANLYYSINGIVNGSIINWRYKYLFTDIDSQQIFL